MAENIYTTKQRHVLIICCLLILAGLILYGLGSYVTAFLAAGIVYVVLKPWFNALVHKRHWNRHLVTILLLIFTIVVLLVPFYALTSLLIGRIRYYSQHTESIMRLVDKAQQLTGFSLHDQANIQQVLQQGAAWLSGRLPSLAGGLLDFLVIMGLMLFTLYFMFLQEEGFQQALRRYLPFRAHTMQQLGDSLRNNVNANVLGQALISLVQAVLTGFTLWLFGVPDAPFWGTVSFFLAFIPVLGTPLVWGPAALIKLSQGDTGQGVGILLVGAIVIINIDNLLRIFLAKRMGDIHPLVTLAGVVLGVNIFGIVGLVIGPLLLSYFLVLMQVFKDENKPDPTTAGLPATPSKPALPPADPPATR